MRTADHVAALTGARRRVHGARAAAEESMRHAPRHAAAEVALVDGEVGIVVAPLGRLVAVVRLLYGANPITAVDVIADRPTLDRTAVLVS